MKTITGRFDSPLAGRHQLRNIALAVAAAEELARFGFKVTPRQVEQGIRETHWPGRFQVLPPSPATHQREMVFDVAHNPAGVWALRSTLSETFPDREFTIVFGAMGDKAVREMAEILFPIAQHVVVTAIANPRSATTEQLLQAGSRTGTPMVAAATVTAALNRAGEITPLDGVIVVAGSIFLVGEAIKRMGISA